jgi:hypothetical protein
MRVGKARRKVRKEVKKLTSVQEEVVDIRALK